MCIYIYIYYQQYQYIYIYIYMYIQRLQSNMISYVIYYARPYSTIYSTITYYIVIPIMSRFITWCTRNNHGNSNSNFRASQFLGRLSIRNVLYVVPTIQHNIVHYLLHSYHMLHNYTYHIQVRHLIILRHVIPRFIKGGCSGNRVQ